MVWNVLVDLGQRNPGRLAQDDRQRYAVRDDQNLGVRLVRGNFLRGGQDAQRQPGNGFAPRRARVQRVTLTFFQFMWVARQYLSRKQPFPIAEVDFAQTRFQGNCQAARFSDQRGGLPGAQQVAAVDGRKMQAAQLFAQRLRLRQPAII